MKRLIALFLGYIFCSSPVYAQSTAEQAQPGFITTIGCPGSQTACFVPYSSSNPLPVGIYGGVSATSGYVLTSNGPGVLATFQVGGGGGGSVSVTASSPNIVVNPSPGTGTFTVGATNPVSSTCGTATSCTILAGDMGQIVENNSASSIAVTLPQCNSGSFTPGLGYSETNYGAGTATITAQGGSNINGSPTSATTLALGKNQSAWLWCDSSGNWNAFLGSFGSSVSWPSNGDIVISSTTNTPSGLAEVDNDCVVGTAGSWVAGSCAGTASANLGASLSGASPQISGDATSGFYTPGAAQVAAAISGVQIQKWSAGATTITGTATITSTNASALAVGASGATNPAFSVDASTASSVTGWVAKSAAAGGGASLTVGSSGANESGFLSSKGTGNLNLQVPGVGAVVLKANSTSVLTTSFSGTSLTPAVSGAAAAVRFNYTPAADTGLTASTNAILSNFAGNGVTRQHATGALALQTDYVLGGTTDSFVGASTLTEGATINAISKNCGTNGTCSAETAIIHQSQALTGTITNSYGGIDSNADTGATNNYSARFTGEMITTGATPAIAAGSGTGGTSPTISGSWNGGTVSLTTGASPSGTNAVIATITYAVPFPTGSSCGLYPANAVTALLSGATMTYTNGTATTCVITSGTSALTALTAYQWNYVIVGN